MRRHHAVEILDHPLLRSLRICSLAEVLGMSAKETGRNLVSTRMSRRDGVCFPRQL